MKKSFKLANTISGNNLPLLIFSVIFYSIIIFLAAYLNVWEDEVYSLDTSSGTLSYAFHQAIYMEAQPPAYFLLLTIWRSIMDSILWARLFSVFLILLSQILLYKFLIHVSNKKIATVFSILFLLNPCTVFTCLEIRTFALVILLSLLLIISFYNIYYSEKITPGKRILFILLAITGLFTQYFIGFILFANALVLLFKKNKRPLFIYILDMIIPLCLILLFIPQILFNVNIATSSLPPAPGIYGNFLLDAASVFVNRTFDYLLPFNFDVPRYWIWIFRVALILLLFASINYIEIRKGLRYIFPFLVITAVTYLFFIMVFYLFGIFSIEYKYTIILFVSLFLAMTSIFKMVKPGFLSLWLVLLGLIFISENYNKYHTLYKLSDYRSLGKYLEKNEKAGEPLFVFRNISAETFGFYYTGINEIIPVPEAFSYDKAWGPEQWEINDEDVFEINKQLIRYPVFYFMIDETALAGFAESKKTLMDFLNRNFNLAEETFFEERITLYKYTSVSTKN